MTATRHRLVTPRRRHRRPELAPTTPARAGLGLAIPDLEELLTAVGDREDTVGPDARARLARGRRALELELADALEQ